VGAGPVTSEPRPVPRAAAEASGTIVPDARVLSRPRAQVRLGLAQCVLALVDWTVVAACLLGTWWVREHLLPRAFPNLGPLLLTPFEYLQTLYFLLPWWIAFIEAGLYTGRVLYWEEARRTLRACTVAALFAALVALATQTSIRLSRLVLVGTWLSTVILLPFVRHHAKRLLAAIGLWRQRVLILGAGETGMDVCERIQKHPVLGYRAVAFVDDAADTMRDGHCGLPVVGPLSEVARFVRQFRVSEVLVALPRMPREKLLKVIAACEGYVSSIRLVPDMFGLATVGVETEDLDGVLVLHMRWNLARPWNLAVKRVFDIVVGAALSIVTLPILALAALAVRLDSRGPVMFRQPRLGSGWSTFPCFKFRTMHVDASERLARHLEAHPGAREEWDRFAKLRSDDPRVTRVGRILRRFSLDELPQILNVMRGEMSLVGPRPYLPGERERMGEFGDTIVKAPPGITGLWQVSGRSDLTFPQRLRLDEYYVRNWSLWLDVIVLIKTAGVVLRGRGAY
jgi:Undecaprenyl-phosphate galactose phosphotransferase WbaP